MMRRDYEFDRGSGDRLHVSEWGAREAPVSLLLLHGWGLSSRTWEDVADLVGSADTRVRIMAYDHRGHGLSATGTKVTVEGLADDLAAVVTELVPQGPIVFAGHSMGAMVVMALAERHRELVRDRAGGVAFVSTSAGELGGWMRRAPALARIVFAISARTRPGGLPLALRRRMTRNGMFGSHARSHDVDRVIRQAMQSDPRAVADLGLSLLRHDRGDVLGAFAELESIILVGELDSVTPPEHARVLAERLPNAELVVLPGAGHCLPYERGELVAEQLLRLVGSARRPAVGRTVP